MTTSNISNTIETAIASDVQAAIELSQNKTAVNPSGQSLKSIDAGRFSGNTVSRLIAVIWEGNLNRVVWGNIPSLANELVKNLRRDLKATPYPGIFEGFVSEGLFHVTDGARRLVASTYAIANYDLTPEEIERLNVLPVKLVDGTNKARLYASQLLSETQNKTPYECAVIVSRILECVNDVTGKNYTQREAGELVNRDDATITGYMQFIREASTELKAQVENGDITMSDGIAAVKENRRKNKEAAKVSGKAIMGTKAQSVTEKAAKVNHERNFAEQAETILCDCAPEHYTDNGDQRVSVDMSKAEYDQLIAYMTAYQNSKAKK